MESDNSDREDPSDAISAFEKKLKQKGLRQESSSSDEDHPGHQVKFAIKKDYSNYEAVPQPSEVQNKQYMKEKLFIEQIIQKDKEIKRLESQIEELSQQNTGPVEQKIAQLAKQNRALQVALESEKTKNQKLQQELTKLKEQQEEKQQKGQVQSNPGESTFQSLKQYEEMVQQEQAKFDQNFKAKFQEAEKKVNKQRQENQKLKNDLQKALRVIQREVYGNEKVQLEQINIDKILNEEGWKGRAEQIEKLKHKLKNAKTQQSNLQNLETQSVQSQSQTSKRPMTEAGQSEISKPSIVSAKKAKELEELKESYEQIQKENQQLKQKYQAANARKQVLENELKEIRGEMKKQLQVVLAKSDQDDQLIHCLKKELQESKLKKGKSENINQTQEGNFVKLDPHVSYLNSQIHQLKMQVMEQQEEIRDFKMKSGENEGELAMEISNYMQQIADLKEENEDIKKEMQSIIDEYENREPIQAPKKGKLNEDKQIIKQLSSQNATLRNKIDSLEQQLKEKGSKKK